MQFKSINPFNNQVLGIYEEQNPQQVQTILKDSEAAFLEWSQVPHSERTKLMSNVAQILQNDVDKYAKTITLEMGKIISESRSEIKKCSWVCDYYAQNASEFLASEKIDTGSRLSMVRNDPIGTILAIMPWNFPFWQVFRFAAPAIMAGNTGLLKHATNVFGCAKLIAELFEKAGFPAGVMQNIYVDHDQIEKIVAHDSIAAVSLTGSERAGRAVASLAGRYLKKSVLELGGNNAFIVLPDADLEQAVKIGVTARMLNAGQSCIAAKRFILVDEIYDDFVSGFLHEVAKLRLGDPMQESTQMGPLARKDLAENLNLQIMKSVELGATILIGGKRTSCFHEPTILENVKPGMPAFDEETFGPLAAMIRAESPDHALQLAGNSKYGLGLTVFTKEINKVLKWSSQVKDGAFFINEMVKSDPRLPFGGTKCSGFGRELAKDGILEFVNRKTVYVL